MLREKRLIENERERDLMDVDKLEKHVWHSHVRNNYLEWKRDGWH